MHRSVRITDIYIPVFQLCTKKRAGQDISRYIMGFIMNPTMNYINELNIIHKIQKINLTVTTMFTYHVSNLVYQTMDIENIKDIIEKNIDKHMKFSHYCCGNNGVLYKTKTNFGLYVTDPTLETVFSNSISILTLANDETTE